MMADARKIKQKRERLTTAVSQFEVSSLKFVLRVFNLAGAGD